MGFPAQLCRPQVRRRTGRVDGLECRKTLGQVARQEGPVLREPPDRPLREEGERGPSSRLVQRPFPHDHVDDVAVRAPLVQGPVELLVRLGEPERVELVDAKKREKNPSNYAACLLFFNQVKLIKRSANVAGSASFRSKITSKTVTSKNTF